MTIRNPRPGLHLDEDFVLEDIDCALGEEMVATCSLEMEPAIYKRFLELIGKEPGTTEMVGYKHIAVYSTENPPKKSESYVL